MYNLIITDVDKNGPSAHGENRTQEPQPPLIHHEHQDEVEAPHSTSTSKKDGGRQLWCMGVSEDIPGTRGDIV